ncbi:aminotransferase class IV [Kineosporia succinea]|uniref:aminotransferase class IV n=1 Tax=Kineosporia succinea TaxID=84632 RepID=UPI0027D8A831|nr:aminotransferase class IV [Kineosporia succinea]
MADSWLVDEGRCRGVGEHRARFVRSVRRVSAPTADDAVRWETADRFVDDVLHALPRTGRWFPRISWDEGEFTLWVRPAPELRHEVAVWVTDGPDPREDPWIKGPDLPRMQALRDRAAATGAGEALLRDDDGCVREGALSALLWWRGDVLCCPPEGPDLLPSVTRRLLLDNAARQGVRVCFERVPVTELDGLEVWSVSALHGIRAVTAWTGDEALTPRPGPARRAPRWQAALEDLAVPLP